MAYVDRSTDPNHRLLTGAAVAVIQGAAIVLIVNGLAVHFIPHEPVPRIEGEQITMPLPPPPPNPRIEPEENAIRPIADTPRQTLPTRPDLVPMHVDRLPVLIPDSLPVEPQPFVRPTPQPSAALPQNVRPRSDPQNWVTSSDYPSRELREGRQGLVRYSLMVGADGRVDSCVVTRSSGHARLDQAACRVITRRARFEPATDAGGSRVAGSYTGSVRWQIPED